MKNAFFLEIKIEECFLRNVRNHLQRDAASFPRKLESYFLLSFPESRFKCTTALQLGRHVKVRTNHGRPLLLSSSSSSSSS